MRRAFRRAALALLLGMLGAQTLQAEGRLFLWEVESASGTVYLLGSIHLARPEIYPLDAAIEQAFERSSTLVVEADLSEMNDPALQALVLQAGLYGGEQTLAGSLSEPTLEALKRHTEQRGMPMASFTKMRPWLVAVSLTVAEMLRLGLDPESGIDRHFLDRAKAARLSIEQLESARAQIELLASIPEPLQERFLVHTLEEADRVAEMVDTLMTAWKQGDTASLARLLLESMGQDEELKPVYDRLYTERNRAMAAKIRGYLERPETSFVVVGAAHLVGEGSIVDLLGRDTSADLSIRQLAASEALEPAAQAD